MMSKHTLFSLTAVLVTALAGSPGHADLLLHYTGDLDGANFDDSSGLGHDGVQDGTNQELANTKIGNTALKINGGATDVSVADGDPDFDTTYTNFTFTAWMDPGDAEDNVNRWIAGKMGGSGDRGWQISRGTDEAIGFLFFDSAGGTQDSVNSGSATVADVGFTHVAATYDNSNDTIRVYLDGQLAATTVTSLATLNGSNSVPLQIGNRGNNQASSTGAVLDDVSIWNETLSTSQIQRVVNAGNDSGLNLQEALADTILDRVESVGDYTISYSGQTLANATRSPGAQGLYAQADDNFASLSGNRNTPITATIELTAGFGASDTIEAGIYEAYVQVGAGNIGRETFETFDLGLRTLAGDIELPNETVIDGYAVPADTEWDLVRVAYEVPTGSALIGQEFTWFAVGTFDSATGEYGAFDDFLLVHIPEPSSLALAALGLLGLLACRRRRRR